MMPGTLLRALLALALLMAQQIAAAQIPVPPLKERVTDLTGTLTADQRAALETTLAGLEARKGSQVAVLIVPTTQPETVEQYSIRVAEAWKLGRKGVDDGVLLLVAKNDRRLRIEVGYGLEGVIPDAGANRIIGEDIAPRFREGDFYGGIHAGAERIVRLIEGEPLPAARSRPNLGLDTPWPGSTEWVILALIIALLAAKVLDAMFGRLAGSALVGVAAAAAGWVILGSLTVGVALGAVVFVVVLLGRLMPATSARRGGWWNGGGTGGGSGGGFGGSGGSFGGGGASGRW